MAKIIDMEKTLDGIELFMRKCEQPTYRVVPRPSLKDSILRLRLIREELIETFIALSTSNYREVLDGMADVVYVAGGGVLLFEGEFCTRFEEDYNSDVVVDFQNVHVLREAYANLIFDASHALAEAEMEVYALGAEIESKVYEISHRALHLIIGHAETGNIPLQDFIDEVQRSNMTKLPVLRRNEDGTVAEYGTAIKDKGGKVLKPETFEPVDFSPLMEKLGI